MNKIEIGTYVVVTTDSARRGGFGGVLQEDNFENGEVILTEARNAVSWSKETKGFLGLSAVGPQAGSRISPPAPLVKLNGVVSMAKCSSAARDAWESDKWS